MADKDKGSPTTGAPAALKPRLPRGFADRSAAEIRATDAMIRTIRGVYERYGFEPVETPLIEYTDALGKFLPDQDRPNEGVFSFRDDDEAWLSLRYDLTAPLARYVAENYDRLPKPYRSYRSGWVFRNEKPGPGRFRQFMQFDADTVGAASPAADAEMCMMMADTLEALGIPRGDYVIKVNSRKVLDGVMERAGVITERQKLAVLRAIDKLDRLGIEGVRQLLGAGRKDESGDFAKGAGLSEGQTITVLGFLGTARKASAEISGRETLPPGVTDADMADWYLLDEMQSSFFDNEKAKGGLDDLETIWKSVRSAGYGIERISFDPSVVRGLEYYTGPVFEAELLFETVNDKGEPARFGSVGGGGRYDGLVGRFREENVPATGFSIGVSRLMAALSALGKVTASETAGPVVVLVLDRDRLSDYQKLVSMLRAADLRAADGQAIGAELYLGESGMKAQMKYADRRNAPCVIIQGSDERAAGTVQIKDLALGKVLSAGIADNKAWREERPAQYSVREDELVTAVRDLLARQGQG